MYHTLIPYLLYSDRLEGNLGSLLGYQFRGLLILFWAYFLVFFVNCHLEDQVVFLEQFWIFVVSCTPELELRPNACALPPCYCIDYVRVTLKLVTLSLPQGISDLRSHWARLRCLFGPIVVSFVLTNPQHNVIDSGIALCILSTFLCCLRVSREAITVRTTSTALGAPHSLGSSALVKKLY